MLIYCVICWIVGFFLALLSYDKNIENIPWYQSTIPMCVLLSPLLLPFCTLMFISMIPLLILGYIAGDN